jgi:hypothetical protein
MYMGITQVVDEYGRWKVTQTESEGINHRYMYHVERKHEQDQIAVSDGSDGKKLARTLAAALDAAGTITEPILPPSLGPNKHEGDEWEEWSDRNDAVPAKIATAGNAAIAGWLKVVHQERESWIATKMDVSKSTVRQYLSDLREGRR